jgi:radical SAM protein with 4Fe4S-binding SPASM domain
MKLIKVDKQNKFIATFNTEDGQYIRTGVIKNGIDTGVDPFMASFPELIDIGIMGSCAHAKQCTVGCYQGGINNQKPNMTLNNYKSIIDQCKGKVFQVALGGHGDPNKHENFEEIFKYTRENNIVPNYTTSGLNLTDKEVELTKEYCGAVAVSMYRNDYTFKALQKFIDAGCTTNIHYVLSNKTIDEAIDILKYSRLNCSNSPFVYDMDGINAIIFLLHKPVGCGKEEDVLDINNPKLKEFFSLVSKEHPFKVGFDSCTVPGLVNMADINFDSVDTCEGARYSMYISSDMVAVPCSFDQEHRYGVNLSPNQYNNGHTIKQAWDSILFDNFRNHMQNSCKGCVQKEICKGGCPLEQGIVLCGRSERGEN